MDSDRDPVGVRRDDHRGQEQVLGRALSPPGDDDLVDPGRPDLVHLLRHHEAV